MARNDLRIDLDRASGIALPVQIIRGVRAAVAAGRLAPGDRLPSARACAEALGVSRGTVDTAYAQLAAEGYVVQRPRSGTVIDPELPAAALAAPRVPRSSPPPRAPAVRVDLRPGRGGDPPLGEAAFRTAWRRALDVRPAPPDPFGEEPLRRAVAEHLRVMRGMVVEAEDIVITAGSRDGVALVLSAIGAGALAVEDPGFPGLRRALHGVELVPVSVDADGLSPEGLAGAEDRSGRLPDAALVTPNHQFPYGTAMPAGRRAALCRWAADAGMLLIEDDYDSEARYLGPAVAPLFDSAPGGGVVHIGTFSTVLTAAVGTGYIVARGPAGARIREARERLGPAVPPVMQHAIAEYLAAGGLRRRIARGRRRLRAAEAVVAEFSRLPGLVHRGRGLVVEMPAEVTRRAHRALAARGIRVGDLAAGWSGEPRRHGLVIAHANGAPAQLREALAVVAASG